MKKELFSTALVALLFGVMGADASAMQNAATTDNVFSVYITPTTDITGSNMNDLAMVLKEAKKQSSADLVSPNDCFCGDGDHGCCAKG